MPPRSRSRSPVPSRRPSPRRRPPTPTSPPRARRPRRRSDAASRPDPDRSRHRPQPMTSRTRVAADQLALELDGIDGELAGRTGSGDRVVPMQPGEGQAPFDDARWFFEPWWPGMSATLVVDAGRITLVTDQLTDPLPAFPELKMLAEHV